MKTTYEIIADDQLLGNDGPYNRSTTNKRVAIRWARSLCLDGHRAAKVVVDGEVIAYYRRNPNSTGPLVYKAGC